MGENANKNIITNGKRDVEALFSNADFSKESDLKEILWKKISHIEYTSIDKLMKEEGMVSIDQEGFSKSKHVSPSRENVRSGPEVPRIKPQKGRVL